MVYADGTHADRIALVSPGATYLDIILYVIGISVSTTRPITLRRLRRGNL